MKQLSGAPGGRAHTGVGLSTGQSISWAAKQIQILHIAYFKGAVPLVSLYLKAVANEDTMLRTQILCRRHKNVSDFCQKHFAANVSLFPRNGHKTNVLCPARLPTQETS